MRKIISEDKYGWPIEITSEPDGKVSLSESASVVEAKQVGILYHQTSSKGLRGIVSSRFVLDGNVSRRYDRDDQACVSFTRDKSFKFMPGTYYPKLALYKESNPAARLVIDGDKLSQRYSIEPYNDRPEYGTRFRKNADIFSDSEAEERICKLKVDVLPALIRVEVRKRYEEKLAGVIEQMRSMGIEVAIVDRVW